ncbi:unnamed protein product [Fraxinus pennsylvanica]|uniref:Protein kinase domain-containing protein n=1 Tax=Fraxinus pennsylvanica TaxID=56036 RepID=A0AAD2ECH1_9LAMI|nr:unnamed protein product [Fraxinus pennsylvanica]
MEELVGVTACVTENMSCCLRCVVAAVASLSVEGGFKVVVDEEEVAVLGLEVMLPMKKLILVPLLSWRNLIKRYAVPPCTRTEARWCRAPAPYLRTRERRHVVPPSACTEACYYVHQYHASVHENGGTSCLRRRAQRHAVKAMRACLRALERRNAVSPSAYSPVHQKKETAHVCWHYNWDSDCCSIYGLADLKGLGQHTGLFTLRQIRAATNNFDPANKIGEGGFGPVYKGHLQSDGTIIAVKQLSSKSKDGNREFVNEIGMISALQHPHLVKLYGCCIEGNQLLHVYEHMENNSLARALFDKGNSMSVGTIIGIVIAVLITVLLVLGIFWWKGCLRPKDTLEQDLKGLGQHTGLFTLRQIRAATNNFDPANKIGEEIVSGRSNTSIRPKENSFYLLDWANSLKAEGKLMELVDPRLESNFNEEEVITTINLALCCTNAVAAERPSMSAVVSILEGRAHVGEFVSDSSVSIYKMKPTEITSQDHVTNSSISLDMPWTSSSKSTSDLYPITLDTNNWED